MGEKPRQCSKVDLLPVDIIGYFVIPVGSISMQDRNNSLVILLPQSRSQELK
jgi:hypothetical protein